MMLAVLARASLEGAIVAALVWIAIRWLPRLSPATRAALWWCAAAKFLLALVWVTPVELRVLPARAGAPAALSRPATVASTAHRAGHAGAARPGLSSAPADDANVNWPVILLVLWSAGLVAGAVIDLRRLTRTRRVIRRSSPATEQTAATAAELAAAIGLRRHAHGAYFQRDGHAAGRRRPASAHPSARERRHAALGRRGADGALPRAVARQACGSLAGAGAGGRRASLLLSSVRAAGIARVPALPGSGLRRGRDRHARGQPAGLRPAAPVARRVASPLESRRRRRLIILFDAETENCHASRFVAITRSAGG